MPTTRTRRSRNQRTRITPEVMEAYRAGDHLRLHALLRLRPWEPSPLDTDTPEPPASDGTAWANAWPEVHALRVELEGGRGTPGA